MATHLDALHVEFFITPRRFKTTSSELHPRSTCTGTRLSSAPATSEEKREDTATRIHERRCRIPCVIGVACKHARCKHARYMSERVTMTCFTHFARVVRPAGVPTKASADRTDRVAIKNTRFDGIFSRSLILYCALNAFAALLASLFPFVLWLLLASFSSHELHSQSLKRTSDPCPRWSTSNFGTGFLLV
jgi:hypothetical protein